MKLILNLFKPVECKCGKGAGCCKNKKATKINELSSSNTNSPHVTCGCGNKGCHRKDDMMVQQ